MQKCVAPDSPGLDMPVPSTESGHAPRRSHGFMTDSQEHGIISAKDALYFYKVNDDGNAAKHHCLFSGGLVQGCPVEVKFMDRWYNGIVVKSAVPWQGENWWQVEYSDPGGIRNATNHMYWFRLEDLRWSVRRPC